MTCSCGKRVYYYNNSYNRNNHKISWVSNDILSQYIPLNYIRLKVTDDRAKNYIFINDNVSFSKDTDYYAILRSDLPNTIVIRDDGQVKN